MIYQPRNGELFPPPLGLSRNEGGPSSEFNLDSHNLFGKEASDCPDQDSHDEFHGASIRRGPYMLNKQEDRIIVKEKLNGSQINGLYGVADGHAGFHASQYCKLKLAEKVEELVKFELQS